MAPGVRRARPRQGGTLGRRKSSRRTCSGYFLDTYSSTEAQGATLSVAGVLSRRVALVVTKCPGCGSVEVLFNGRRLAIDGTRQKTVSLEAPTTRKRQLVVFKPAPSASRLPARVEIRVVSAGKRVEIDGLGVY